MVPIKGEWTKFSDELDKIKFFRKWGLVSPKSETLCPVMCVDGYFDFPIPCEVVGYQGENWAVIQLDDGYHSIYGEYLAELQPRVPSCSISNLPRRKTFTDVLSDYVVLDIETTGLNPTQDEIIEIAAARYQYGKLVSEYQTFVKPTVEIPHDVEVLTGISQKDVEHAPSLVEIRTKFFKFIGDLPLIGHNILRFDIKFLSAAFDMQFRNTIVDTIPIAKDSFPLLPNHKLQYLKDTLQLDTLASHRALNDVYITNSLLWACFAPRRYEAKVTKAFWDNKLSNPSTESTSKSQRHRSSWKKVDVKNIKPICKNIDANSPLYCKNIAFTGHLTIPRESAMQMAVNAGATLKTSVSTKLHYLVVGKQDMDLVGEDGMSSKQEKAHELNQSGKAEINIITEEEFIALVKKEGAVL